MGLKMKISDLPADYFPSFKPMSNAERKRQFNKRHPGLLAKRMRELRAKNPTRIAVLDLETDPFDSATRSPVYPFLAVLYSDQFDPIIIWEEDWRKLIHIVKETIENLPEKYIIYAHNGGRFDYMFLIHELRGQLVFKGRSLMSARIGNHELRDSFHILPEKLKSIGGKDEISYTLMEKRHRNKKDNRAKIIDYCIADCRYLFDSVSAFRNKFGSPLTIGQAAIRELKKEYQVENLNDETDLFFRPWFFGGRVECYRYGVVRGNFSLFDVNSMYPYVMARRSHPIGREVFINDRIREGKTVFVTLRCKNNGALVCRDEHGGLTTQCREGIFNTTIWEYETAVANNLITDIEIIRTVEFQKFTNFSRFVEPIFQSRMLNKRALDQAYKDGNLVSAKQLHYDVLFAKLLLNNAYGKFAQNPRRFKDHIVCDPGEMPGEEWGTLPEVETDEYCIWSKPNPEFRFNNVATAASITGAARAELLAAICSAKNTLYCDTDSIICSDIGDNIRCDPFELGAWDCEAKLSTFIGNGKKLYAYERTDKQPPNNIVIKAKGINGVTWQDMIDLSEGKKIDKVIHAPTIGKDGTQQYITRNLSRTGL